MGVDHKQWMTNMIEMSPGNPYDTSLVIDTVKESCFKQPIKQMHGV